MGLIIVLDPELGVGLKEFAAAWNADPEYSAQGTLEERRPGETFDVSLVAVLGDLLHAASQAAPYLTYVSTATTMVINGAKIVKFIREKFGARVDVENVEAQELQAGDKGVVAIKKRGKKKAPAGKAGKKKK